jgi:hypothetical protein
MTRNFSAFSLKALELRGYQAPETEPPLFFRLRDKEVFFGRHARSPKRCD